MCEESLCKFNTKRRIFVVANVKKDNIQAFRSNTVSNIDSSAYIFSVFNAEFFAKTPIYP